MSEYRGDECRFMAADTVAEDREGLAPQVVGYAAVFNSLSNDMRLGEGRMFREVIRPGAFAESLGSGDDIIARFEHSALLGRLSNGTLRLKEDERGLRYELDPPDTQAGRDLMALLKRRDIKGSSFTFRVRSGGDSWRREGETMIREIRSAKLLEISPVSIPAYPATEAAARSMNDAKLEARGCVVRMSMRLALAEQSK